MSGPKRWRSSAVAVEFTIIVPVLLLFIIGLMDCGRLVWTYTSLSRAVEAAARCASVNATLCSSTTAIQNYAVTQAWGLSPAASVFAVSQAACGTSVVGTLPFNFFIPWPHGSTPYGTANTLTLTASACYAT